MLSPGRTLSGTLGLILVLSGGNTYSRPVWDPVGLAAYTETSRDIYIAAVLMPSATDRSTVATAPGPKAMEYRIATPRVSKRGFASMILLQSEMGSGTRAQQEVIEAFKALRTSLKGSLLKGDQFVIALSAENITSFYLNNATLLSVEGRQVFDFFYAGWVGDSSSALLRDSLLAASLDRTLLARYEALHPNQQRIAAIAAWMAPATVAAATPPPQEEAKQESPEPELVAAAASVAAAVNMAEATPPASENNSPFEPQIVAAAEVGRAARDEPENKVAPGATVEPDADAPHNLVAASQPALEEPIETADTLQSLISGDDNYKLEYQRRLDRYMAHVMKKVFGNVNYPRRAIEKQRQGKVELLARLDKSGELLDVTLDNSSGYSALDNAARKAVREAAPFPELPPEVLEEFAADDGESYVVMIPVTFKLLQ